MRVDRRRFQEKARLQPKKNGKICSRNDIPGGKMNRIWETPMRKSMKNEQLKFFCFQVIMRALIDERLDILREVKEHESIKY